jgi:hypothetical protein
MVKLAAHGMAECGSCVAQLRVDGVPVASTNAQGALTYFEGIIEVGEGDHVWSLGVVSTNPCGEAYGAVLDDFVITMSTDSGPTTSPRYSEAVSTCQ